MNDFERNTCQNCNSDKSIGKSKLATVHVYTYVVPIVEDKTYSSNEDKSVTVVIHGIQCSWI